jgi:hypothetical protein
MNLILYLQENHINFSHIYLIPYKDCFMFQIQNELSLFGYDQFIVRFNIILEIFPIFLI